MRQHDDLSLRRLLTKGSGDRHAVHPCSPHINSGHGRLEANGEFKRRSRIDHTSDDFNVVRKLEQANDRAAHLRITIGNKYTNRFMLRRFRSVAPSKTENNPVQVRAARAGERLSTPDWTDIILHPTSILALQPARPVDFSSLLPRKSTG